MYDTTGKRLTSQVTSGRDYSAQEPHPDLITEVPTPTTFEEWEQELSTTLRSLHVMWVCVDCYSAHQYGDYSPTDDTIPFSEFDLSDGATPIHQYVWQGLDAEYCDHSVEDLIVSWDEHAEECETLDFSDRPCGACSTTLAGTRHAMMFDERYTR